MISELQSVFEGNTGTRPRYSVQYGRYSTCYVNKINFPVPVPDTVDTLADTAVEGPRMRVEKPVCRSTSKFICSL